MNNNKGLKTVSIQSIVLMIVAMFMCIATSLGQGKMNTTKIKDGTIANSEVTASSTSILELESANKGFLLPRLTNAQRDAISISDKERGNGLSIYNIDTDCINYWSKVSNRWLSLCGTLPPATLDVTNCENIYLSSLHGNNTLKQGEYLRDTDILYITVQVRESGTYNISADTNNGYSFSRSGTFNSPGIYTLALEGLGTPLSSNETIGDLVSFTINGSKSGVCENFRIKVLSSAIEFAILDQNITASWNAYIDVPLTASKNSVKVKVNVVNTGYWQMASNPTTVNGMSFSGSGQFTKVGEQEIELVGQGTPIKETETGKPNVFKFRTNSTKGDAPNIQLSVNVLPVSFEMVCDDPSYPVEFRGEYKEDVVLNNNNAILLPVKVKAPGSVAEIALIGQMKGDGFTADIKYVAKNVVLTFNSSRNDIQYVTLYPEKEIKVNKGITSIEFNGITPSSVKWCGTNFPKIKVETQEIRYSVLCNSIIVNGNYNTETDLTADNYIEITVNVDYAGAYNISTNEVNGVKFIATGTFTGKGQQKIKLLPEGKFHTGGYINYTITTNSAVGNTVCSATVTVKEREIVILTLGNVNYAASPVGNAYAGSAILKSTKNFGPNGIVKVNNIRILNTGLQGEALRSYLNTNKVDIIHNVIGYNAYGATLDVFKDFVEKDKGVVIISDENTVHTTTKQFIEMLTGQSVGTASGKYTMNNPVLTTASNESIVKGPFGDLNGKYIGNDASNGWYFEGVTTNNQLTPLISRNKEPNAIWGLKHKSLGFAFFGDGGWVVGTMSNTSTNVWPSRYLADGTPIAKPYWENTDVYNSVLYANLMAWAIDYVKQNKPIR